MDEIIRSLLEGQTPPTYPGRAVFPLKPGKNWERILL